MKNKDDPLDSVLTLAILAGLLSRMDDGEGPSPAIIFLSYLTVLCSTHLIHLNESSEGCQPSARTAYNDGST